MVAGRFTRVNYNQHTWRIATYAEQGRSKRLNKSMLYETFGLITEPIVAVDNLSPTARAALESLKSTWWDCFAGSRMIACGGVLE